MATLKLEIVTPEEKIYSEDVEMVTLPGSEGELGVYPKHVPLLTTLNPGELRVVKSGRESTMAIGEGFVEIKGDAVSVLTDMAMGSEKIDIATAEAAVERAKAAMKEDHSAEEVAAIQASLQKALTRVTFCRGGRRPTACTTKSLAQPPLHALGIIAGNGVYPRLLADAAR